MIDDIFIHLCLASLAVLFADSFAVSHFQVHILVQGDETTMIPLYPHLRRLLTAACCLGFLQGVVAENSNGDGFEQGIPFFEGDEAHIFLLNATSESPAFAYRFGYGDYVELSARPMMAFLSERTQQVQTYWLYEESPHVFSFELLPYSAESTELQRVVFTLRDEGDDDDDGSHQLLVTDESAPFTCGGSVEEHQVLFAPGSHELRVQGYDDNDVNFYDRTMRYVVELVTQEDVPSASVPETGYQNPFSGDGVYRHTYGLVEQIHGNFVFTNVNFELCDDIEINSDFIAMESFGYVLLKW